MTAPSLPQLPLSEEQIDKWRDWARDETTFHSERLMSFEDLCDTALAALTATQRASDLARRVAELEKLLRAVVVSEYETDFNDVDGKNWFDVRDAAIKETS